MQLGILSSWRNLKTAFFSISGPVPSSGKSKASSASGSPRSSTNSTNGHCVRSDTTSAMHHLVEKTDFAYADFAQFKESTPTFRASDYNWESQGYSIANRLYPEMGDLLDEKFRMAQQFTYYT